MLFEQGHSTSQRRPPEKPNVKVAMQHAYTHAIYVYMCVCVCVYVYVHINDAYAHIRARVVCLLDSFYWR